MGKMKRTKRFALVKRMISTKEKKKQLEQQQSKGKNGHADDNPSKRSKHDEDVSKALMAQVHRHEQASSALYFRYNTQLGPPYHILIGKLLFFFPQKKYSMWLHAHMLLKD